MRQAGPRWRSNRKNWARAKKKNEAGGERRKRLPANPTILKNAPSVSFFPSPSPFIPFFWLSPNFLDELARKRLLCKRVVLRKKGGYTQATSSFQFRLVNIFTAHDLATSLASSLILRAKP